MKKQSAILPLIIFLFISACHAQKMMRTVNDAPKLALNKDSFVGKPLLHLINEIGPQIKSAIGAPNNTGRERPVIIFYFVDKKQFLDRDKKGEKPTRIGVYLAPKNGKIYPPLKQAKAWTNEETKIYGDMTVTNIWVSGEN